MDDLRELIRSVKHFEEEMGYPPPPSLLAFRDKVIADMGKGLPDAELFERFNKHALRARFEEMIFFSNMGVEMGLPMGQEKRIY